MSTDRRDPSTSAIREEFEQFWTVFPRKVGKLAAAKEWHKARKTAAFEDIMAAVERYKTTKPAYADWCHPRTWLSQGRWMDEADVTPKAPEPYHSRVERLSAEKFFAENPDLTPPAWLKS